MLHEPLVGEHRLDDLAGALAARHHAACASSPRPAGLRLEVGEHRLARDEAVEAAVLLRRVVVDRRVERQDVDQRQAVALADLRSR